MTTYDVAVIGIGGVGSSALYHLAKSGARVIGLDRFAPPHSLGSSHGQTRVIRMAYFEHPDYVPLLRQAYQGWAELESASERSLYFPTGVLQIGPESGEVIAGVRKSAEQHQLAIDSFSHEEISKAFPGLVPPENCVGLLERNAGYLLVSECIDAYLKLAVQHGAEMATNCPVHAWDKEADEYVLQSDTRTIHAKQLVICGGAWAQQLLADLNVPLTILRKQLYWFENQVPHYTSGASFPVFLFETVGGIYYGFPQIDAQGVKLARHDGGETIASAQAHSQSEDIADRQSVEAFVQTCMPQLSTNLTRHAACMYTMTPDQHFLVGSHPEQSGLHFAAGLSGHGFKFASALGQILCDLATTGQTASPIGFLSPNRFS
ncbi:N-methyl-L-tryptophan oxidase [Bremerella cremea]|uniref:N-methyl-L-tryptophan oxidase n=1 Tax=Bremerella cremea TaxID=1031537 RepID=UPI0031E83462